MACRLMKTNIINKNKKKNYLKMKTQSLLCYLAVFTEFFFKVEKMWIFLNRNDYMDAFKMFIFSVITFNLLIYGLLEK